MNDVNDAPEAVQDETPDMPETTPEIDYAEELLARDKDIADQKDRLLRQAAVLRNTAWKTLAK